MHRLGVTDAQHGLVICDPFYFVLRALAFQRRENTGRCWLELCGSLAGMLPADELHAQAAAACQQEAALEAQLQQFVQQLEYERVQHAAALHAKGEQCRAALEETARVRADLRQLERRRQAQAGQLEQAEAARHVRRLFQCCRQHAASQNDLCRLLRHWWLRRPSLAQEQDMSAMPPLCFTECSVPRLLSTCGADAFDV